jgi:AcrR family transcriptional regulator
MARSVKEEEHAGKRNAILDVAQRLVYRKGYEQMTIQDLLDDLQISKGAFYHYFGSKQAVLEALVERMQEEVKQLLLPVVQDPHLLALDKLRRFFPVLSQWKTARKDFVLSLVRILYADDNALFRQKVRAGSIKAVTPLLAAILRQGVQEGVLTISYPDQVGEVVLALLLDLGDTFAGLLLSSEPHSDTSSRLESTVAAYTDALERVLGAPPGSLPLADAEALKEWVVILRDRPERAP